MTPARLERSIQGGLLLLVALMPFHAFLSVYLGHLIGHQSLIQAWKEALLVILTLAAAILVWREPTRLQRLRQPWALSAATLGVIALIVTLITRPPLTAIAYGAKTDLEFLLAAILAALVANAKFWHRLPSHILAGASLVVAFGLAQAYLLPPDFLVQFGYGPATILPYQHITQGATSLRFPSTLGGPNQLGTYLILPLCLSLALALRRRQWPWLILTTATTIVLINTYSRGAWLGAFAAVAITLLLATPARLRRPLTLGLGGLILALAISLPLAIQSNAKLQYYLLHASLAAPTQNDSNAQHSSSLTRGFQADTAHPLGHGLGTAGPATFHAGSTNIIENYYLQIGYETGLLGLLVFVGLTATVIIALLAASLRSPLVAPTAAAIAGISLVALFLPAWADSSTALIVWITAGSLATNLPHHQETPDV